MKRVYKIEYDLEHKTIKKKDLGVYTTPYLKTQIPKLENYGMTIVTNIENINLDYIKRLDKIYNSNLNIYALEETKQAKDAKKNIYTPKKPPVYTILIDTKGGSKEIKKIQVESRQHISDNELIKEKLQKLYYPKLIVEKKPFIADRNLQNGTIIYQIL